MRCTTYGLNVRCMSEPQQAPPTAHDDEESETPAAGVDAASSPDVEVLEPQSPQLAGKRGDESDALVEDDSTPSFRDG